MAKTQQMINYKIDSNCTKFINIKDIIHGLYRDLEVINDPVTKDYIQQNIDIWECFANQ